jgi:hypothetical protein
MADWPRQSWLEAEPERAQRESDEMTRVAPDMAWLDDDPAGGWEGLAPIWPFERSKPAGLDNLLEGQRLRLRVFYSQGFPMVQPLLVPLDPDPPRDRRILHSWHLNGDGSLCLLQTAYAWDGRETAADLVVKASGWFIEYLLREREAIEAMTENGISADTSLDRVIEELGE